MLRSMLMIAVLVLASGCGRDSDEDVAKRLESKGTMEVMEEAAQNEYTAPQDNRLVESQIGMYLKVREREAQIAAVSRKQLEEHSKESDQSEGGVSGFMAGVKGLGSMADLMTADIRAAQELGYNTAEYQWVKERVLEASGDALREQMSKQLNEMLDKQYAEAKAGLEKATTDEEKQMYEQAMKGVEEMKASSAGEAPEPWITYNRELLSGHEDALKAMEMELAKYHGEPQPSDTATEASEEATEPESQ